MKALLKYMSKFKIFLLLLLLGAIIASLFGWRYITSLRNVSFVLNNGVVVDVYKVVDGKKQDSVKTVSTSTTIPLQIGDFCAQPTSDRYVTDPICFTVNDKDISVDINPNYSNDTLAKMLLGELENIKTVINNSYKEVIDDFTVVDGVLYSNGEWYGTTLTQKTSSANEPKGDVYRLIAKKENNTWKIINYPEIALSKFDYPDVPRYILDAVNKLSGNQ